LAYLIGVDGGGSKTTALLARLDEVIIGRGSSGSSNYRAVGLESACASLDQALRAAFASAGLDPDPGQVQIAYIGLAGVDRPGDHVPLQAWAERQWPGMPVEFVSDVRLVLAAGTPKGWGIAVICGTGSIVYGRSPHGQTARAGGWGYLLGDEGSGYHIGLTALRCVARAADGRSPPTLLTGLILDNWSLSSVQELVDYVYRPQLSKTEVAALAALVERAARQEDPIAQGILRQAGEELATAASVVADRLQLSGPLPTALAGGVMLHSELVARAFLTAAAELDRHLSPVQHVTEPALGAIRLAGERARRAKGSGR
jgi:N-acetylmuramic acid 6-phosphate etherase